MTTKDQVISYLMENKEKASDGGTMFDSVIAELNRKNKTTDNQGKETETPVFLGGKRRRRTNKRKGKGKKSRKY